MDSYTAIHLHFSYGAQGLPVSPGRATCNRGRRTGHDITWNRISRDRRKFPSNPSADVHGCRYLLHEGTFTLLVHESATRRKK